MRYTQLHAYNNMYNNMILSSVSEPAAGVVVLVVVVVFSRGSSEDQLSSCVKCALRSERDGEGVKR